MSNETAQPAVTATTYTVWPTGYDPEAQDEFLDEVSLFTLAVEQRAPGRFAVTRNGRCLRNDGRQWEYESLPSSRPEQFLALYRMPLGEALELARQNVDLIKVNGRTWASLQDVSRV